MNHSGAGHLKWMAVIAGGVFAILVLLGKPAGEALSLAVVIACPLMMVFMMLGMPGHRGHSGEHGQLSNGATPDSGSAEVSVGPATTGPDTRTGNGSVQRHPTGEHQHV